MYILELYQNNYSKDLVVFGSLEEGKEFVSKISGYTIEKEDNDLVNIVGNIIGEVETIEREIKNGEAFKVVNFSVVSKDDEGNKVYHNCSAYGEKSDIPKDFKQGDFVKLLGQIRTSIDDNGKEHSNVRILSSKLLKARKQMKGK